MITLNLLARHFKDTHYVCNCAIEKAATESFGTSVTEHVDSICVHKADGIQESLHEWYSKRSFYDDALKAEACGYDDTVIRTILLQEDQP